MIRLLAFVLWLMNYPRVYPLMDREEVREMFFHAYDSYMVCANACIIARSLIGTTRLPII